MITPLWSELAENSNVLIIHHWDTDGISSAALITDYLAEKKPKKIEYRVPDIGTFRLQPRSYSDRGNIDIEAAGYDVCMLLDYSVPGEDIARFQRETGIPVVVFDHHLRDPVRMEGVYYNNPVAYGEPGREWPSCTWVIKDCLDIEVSDLVIMGIAGDLENRFLRKGFELFPEISRYLGSDKNRYSIFVRAKDMIDVHYKCNDSKILPELACILLSIGGDPEKVLEKKDWVEKNTALENEIKGFLALDPAETVGKKLAVYRIKSGHNIISALTRRLAENSEYDYVMVVNTGFFINRTQIYVRSALTEEVRNTVLFKKSAIELGAEAGGKDEVAGIIIDSLKTADYLQMVKDDLAG
ncbi:MAG: DHH family phosphoesterase [Elusimicrobiota bacterium]